jgi:hypothetical protein
MLKKFLLYFECVYYCFPWTWLELCQVCVWSQRWTHSLTHSPGFFGRVGLPLFVVNTLACLKNFQKLCLRDIKTPGHGASYHFFAFKKIPNSLWWFSLCLLVSQELKPVIQNASKALTVELPHSPPLPPFPWMPYSTCTKFWCLIIPFRNYYFKLIPSAHLLSSSSTFGYASCSL